MPRVLEIRIWGTTSIDLALLDCHTDKLEPGLAVTYGHPCGSYTFEDAVSINAVEERERLREKVEEMIERHKPDYIIIFVNAPHYVNGTRLNYSYFIVKPGNLKDIKVVKGRDYSVIDPRTSLAAEMDWIIIDTTRGVIAAPLAPNQLILNCLSYIV